MPPLHITSSLLWWSVLIAAPVDAVFLCILAWWIRPVMFRRLKWTVTATMAILFATIWAVLCCSVFWDSVYHYLFPAWSRWFLPLVYSVGFGAAGLLSWWLALWLRGNNVINFCLLVGLWGMGGHVWGVYRGLMHKPPMLQGASPAAAVVFSGFEFMFYGGVILTLATLVSHIREKFHPSNRSRAAGASN